MQKTISVLFLLAVSTAMADVRLPRFFSDHMILQQQTKNAIWGWAVPDERVTVTASWGASASVKADKDGWWKLFLSTPAHRTDQTLTIRGRNTIEIQDVAIGEVWLCAGQSNMGWSTGNSFGAEAEAKVDLPHLRIYRSAREHWHEPLDENRDRLARWKRCGPDSAAETSAVSYYFGKTLHQKLGVPVGIIQRAYAGTPIEGWMPWAIQRGDGRSVEHKERYDANAARILDQDAEAGIKALDAFAKELAEYNAQIDAGETMKNAFKPLSPPIITKPANLGHQYPAHMHNAMICPIRPYGIRGMLWYQGERNSKNSPQAFHYRSQLARLIGHYRESWHDLSNGNVAKDFPFQFTQLPSWNPPQSQPVEGIAAPWVVNRESMRLVTVDVPNTGMAVAIDTGDAVELHPKNKQPIGIRHALFALANTYGKDVVGSGPVLESHEIAGEEIILRFSSIGSGLMSGRKGELDAFAIAGKDRKWHWAKASVGGDSVKVSAAGVSAPVAVRYAWAMNPSRRNLLYNREGLPASPFRTDDWPLFDPHADLVEVTKPRKPEGYVAVDWERPLMVAAPETPLAERAAKSDAPSQPKPQSQPRQVRPAEGLAPEITDLNAKDVSWALEAKLPDLKEPYINPRPNDRGDGIPVGALTRANSDRRAILRFARELNAGEHGEVDSFLLMKEGKLLFESYFRRGRANYPHYQMSITKSYTAMALGRAIQLGHLKLSDLDRPITDFLKELQPARFVDGAKEITLAEALNMHSGIRIDSARAKELMRNREQLAGQGQIQAYLENSAPISPARRQYKYQGSDPSITMQVVEALVPGSARDFIEAELLGKMGITNFAWQEDVSGLPKSAAGSSVRSRDMIKWGMLVLNRGRWNDKQLIPEAFIQKATSRLYTNGQGTSYGYFWWRHDMEVGDRKLDCISGRGAGGQFILILPELKLVAAITAHNKGMGKMLKTFPERVLPAFLERE